MNIIKSLEYSIKEQENMLKEFQQLKRDKDFYLRVLIQAVITNNGVLNIDPSKSKEATEFMETKSLEFGNGKIYIHKECGSLFQEK